MAMGHARDPSSEMENIERLKEDYQRITSALAGHQTALRKHDIPAGECNFIDEYFSILSLREAEIVLREVSDFYQLAHPDDVTPYQAVLNRMLESDIKTSRVVACYLGEHGGTVWLENDFITHKKNGENGFDKIIAYVTSITSRCEKEVQIKQLGERNREIIEAFPEFIFVSDDNFSIMNVLTAPDTGLSHPVEVLERADGRSTYSAEVNELFISSIREYPKGGKLKEIGYPLNVETGRRYFQACITPLEGNKVLALIHDIDNRVRCSQELPDAKRRTEEADRMKSLFLTSMGHEIHTPLNTIVGFSEVTALIEGEKEKEEYLGIAQQNNNLSSQLINDILDLSRIESGKSEMHCQLTEISGLADEVYKVYRLKMKKGAELNVIRPSDEIWISTDRNRITQVLLSFLSNAVKNTVEGSITLGPVREKEWAEFYMANTSCGISKERLPLISTRFEKLNDFMQGIGLGLPICKSIVERLGSRIRAESEPERGSTFALYLPDKQEQKVTVTERGNVTVTMGPSNRQKKILIAEDVEFGYPQINTLLKRGCTILWVSNGGEAVGSFTCEEPGSTLMNIRMPVMNGIQATTKIRVISQEIPIITVTAYAFCPEGEQAIEAGCNEVIAKPCPLEKLREAIGVYLQEGR